MPASIPLAIFFVIREFPLGMETVTICTMVWPPIEMDKDWACMIFVMTSVVVMVLVPVSIIFVNYVRIMRTLKASIKKFKSKNMNTLASGKPGATIARRLFNSHKEMRVIYFLVLLVFVFCITWTPILISFLLLLYDDLCHALIMTSQMFVFSICVAMSNVCINPVIYAFVNDRYRSGLTKLLQMCRQRSTRNTVYPSTVFQVDVKSTQLQTDCFLDRTDTTSAL